MKRGIPRLKMWVLQNEVLRVSNDTCARTPNKVLSNLISNLMLLALLASEVPEGNFLGTY